jgi:replicative DNA helicase
MSENQLMDRVVSKLSGVSAEKISLGLGLSEQELGRIQMAMVKLHGMKQRYACSTGMTIADTLSIIRHEHTKYGVKAVFIDYAQRITVPSMKADNLYAKGVAISGPLKDLTLALKIPIVLLVQLDRSSHGDTNPDGGNVAESYRFRQDCDQFVIISKKSQKQMDNGGGEQAVGNSFVYLDKNRYGRDGILLDAQFDRTSLEWREVMRR